MTGIGKGAAGRGAGVNPPPRILGNVLRGSGGAEIIKSARGLSSGYNKKNQK